MLDLEKDLEAISKIDRDKVIDLAVRANHLATSCKQNYPVETAAIDLTIVHSRIGLDLDGLKGADDGNFGHDVFGIRQHIDRRTGDLTGFFTPRFALRQ